MEGIIKVSNNNEYLIYLPWLQSFTCICRKRVWSWKECKNIFFPLVQIKNQSKTAGHRWNPHNRDWIKTGVAAQVPSIETICPGRGCLDRLALPNTENMWKHVNTFSSDQAWTSIIIIQYYFANGLVCHEFHFFICIFLTFICGNIYYSKNWTIFENGPHCTK